MNLEVNEKMYLYESYENKKNKINWLVVIVTFLVALSGSYLAQIYFSKIWGNEEQNETERLSYMQEDNNKKVILKEDSENIIEEAMQSVVGISKLQANEESIFDVSLNQKWGIRNRNYCF